MQESTNIQYFPREFLYRNVHYDKGWYFPDEEGDLYGPFLTKAQTEVALQMYVQQLMDGVSPTQIDVVKKLKEFDQ